MTPGRSLSAAWTSVAADALGSGIPMLAGATRSGTAAVAIPVGVLGTVAGVAAHPYLRPTPGDAAMVGVGTTIALTDGLLLGAALSEVGALDDRQVPGLALTLGGATGLGLYAIGGAVEPGTDQMALLGTGAAWGAFYGALIPVGLGLGDDDAAWLFPAAGGSLAATVGTGLAMRSGLAPSDTVVPQLAAVGGAALVSLGTASVADGGTAPAIGAVVGATLGFGVGAALDDRPARAARTPVARLPRIPGTWLPSVRPHVAPDGSVTAVAGVSATGW
jgi:hypothetical protein